jgi:hypothetical protein
LVIDGDSLQVRTLLSTKKSCLLLTMCRSYVLTFSRMSLLKLPLNSQLLLHVDVRLLKKQMLRV